MKKIEKKKEAEKKKGYIEGGYRFFFLKDQGEMVFDYHYHHFHKCLIVQEGSVTYTVEGKEYRLEKNDIIWIPANEAHKVVVDGDSPYERIVIYLTVELLNQISPKINTYIKYIATNHENVADLSDEMSERLVSILTGDMTKSKGSHLEYTIDKEMVTFIQFLEFMNMYFSQVHIQKSIEEPDEDPAIRLACEYILEHIHKEVLIEDISKHVFVSRYYLMRRFKEVKGLSIHQYILHKRLVLARNLMKQGNSLTAIAYEVGFKDYSTFARAFKKIYMKSPRAFLKLNPSQGVE